MGTVRGRRLLISLFGRKNAFQSAFSWQRHPKVDIWQPDVEGVRTSASVDYALDDIAPRLLIQLELEVAARLRFLEQLIK